MSVTPMFSGEVQYRRYSDTSSQGQQIVFAVADREALEPFIGKEGKRFMAVFVELGDDELPVEPVKPAVKVGPLCREAVGYCVMPEFAAWLRTVDYPVESPADIRGALLNIVGGVESRKDLDTFIYAGERFVDRVRIPFLKYMRNRERVPA